MNKRLCILPWIHTSIKPNGEAKPCCRFMHYLPEHKDIKAINIYQNKTADEILNSQAYKDLRQKMLQGDYIPGCAKCYKEEESHGYSMRMGSWEDYQSDKIIRDNDVKIRYLEVAFGNYCNLACRTCNSELSTNWYEDDLALDYKDRQVHAKVENVNYDWNAEELSELQEIKFTGGEPMLHPNFVKFLDILIDADLAKNIKLEIFTNCSWIPKSKILDRIKKFKELRICLSIDGYGKANDYIRHKSDWNTVDASMQEWLEFESLHKHTQVVIAATLSIYNVVNVYKLLDYYFICRTLFGLQNERTNCVVQFATNPDYISLSNIKDKDKCLTLIAEAYNKTVNKDLLDRVNYLITNSVRDTAYAENTMFEKYIQDLDLLRNQNFKEAIPEIKEFI